MPYILVGLLIVGFASGYGTSTAIHRAELIEMHINISAMNREAELHLATLTKQADTAHKEALKLNKELEDANVSAINAINSQHDYFASKRMYDNGRKSNRCTTRKDSNSTEVVRTNENASELSEELAGFLKSEAYRADQITTYAILCQNFIKGLNRDRP
jgi:cell division protein ZapA (FtsZ GTPase activity inhibitor)